MGCCFGTTTGRLPSNALSVPPSDPIVAQLLSELQGEWRIVPLNEAKFVYQSVYVVDDKYILSAGNGADVEQHSFAFFVDPKNPSKLYCDEWGSIITNLDTKNGEIKINNGFNMDLMWKRPTIYYQKPKPKNIDEFPQRQRSYSAPPEKKE